jgi:hypothetical protein
LFDLTKQSKTACDESLSNQEKLNRTSEGLTYQGKKVKDIVKNATKKKTRTNSS